MRIRSTLAFCLAGAALFSAPALACCRDTPNWYAGLNGAVPFLESYTVKTNNPPGGFSEVDPKLTFRPGYGFSGMVGYRVTPWLRTEIESGYYTNSTSKEVGVNGTLPAGTVRDRQYLTTFMANVYVDYHNRSYFTPYAGFGLGVVHVHSPVFVQLSSGGTPVENLKLIEWVPGYQFMTGVGYELHGPQLQYPIELTLGYRYVAAGNPQVEFKSIPGTTESFQHKSQNVELGARFYF